MGTRPLPLAALAAAAAALACAPALAQDEVKPVPGCAGEAFTDPRGDQVEEQLVGLGQRGPDNTDITAGFFRVDNGVVTANIRVADLSTTAPAFTSGLGWFMYYVANGALRFVAAETERGQVTYSHGTLDRSSGLFTTDGPTTGRFFDGADGVVQIQIPDAAGGTPGTMLTSPYAEVDIRTLLIVSPADQAPDTLRGTNYTVGACSDTGGQAAGAGGAAAAGPRGPRLREARQPHAIARLPGALLERRCRRCGSCCGRAAGRVAPSQRGVCAAWTASRPCACAC